MVGYSLLDTTILSSVIGWIGVTVSFTWGFDLLIWVYKENKELEKEPTLEIKNPRVKIDNIGAKDEFKDVLFEIINNGKTKAINCIAEIKVTDVWYETEVLFSDIDIIPNRPETVCLCQVMRKSHAVAFTKKTHKYPALDKGKKYQLEIQLYGDNLAEKNIHRLKLDLSSWENIGIKLV